MTAAVELVLASASPRRADLLRQIGVRFRVEAAAVDESPLAAESPRAFVERVAVDKANAVRSRRDDNAIVLAADTAVVVADRILGKPIDAADARAMLTLLNDRWHSVLTGVALLNGAPERFVVETRVRFRRLEAGEIAVYVDSGECFDKAGAYAIQGLGGGLVASIEGSYSNVVGLPLAETIDALNRFSVRHGLSPRG